MAIQTETRPVSGFKRIRLKGIGEATVVQGERESLTIEADPFLIRHIRSSVHDQVLTISLEVAWWEWLTWWINWLFIADRSVRFRIECVQLEQFSIEGAAGLYSEAIHSETFELASSGSARVELKVLHGLECTLRVSGAGEIRMGDLMCAELSSRISGASALALSGQVGRHRLRISGSGKVDAQNLETRHTQIKISGSGLARVNAQEELQVEISGAGSVEYLGDPQIEQQISGVGTIRKLQN